jgi:DNA-binding MarR family transcriptional regulator
VTPSGDGLLGAIVRLNLAVTQVLDGITGAAGITLADYLVLGAVRATPGHRSSPSAICDVLRRTTGGMSLTLDRIEDAGWVRRSPDPDDRRRVIVELTPLGLDLATRVNAELHAWERSLTLPGAYDETLTVVDGIAAAIVDRVGA